MVINFKTKQDFLAQTKAKLVVIQMANSQINYSPFIITTANSTKTINVVNVDDD